nr:hypothetical protein [Anaerolineae bacterium]
MVQFIVRAAQSAFNEAGYNKAEGYQQAQKIASYMLANMEICKRSYGIDDELELARQLARMVVANTVQ